MALSFTEENYLKAILRLEGGGKKVTTTALSKELSTKASSVTDMMQKLSRKKLVNYGKYQGVSLTAQGRRSALLVVRKHRLWEVFLVDKLGFQWNEVHTIAEQLEHIHSEDLIERLDDFLGNPRFDPHGDPIPDKDGKIVATSEAIVLQDCLPGSEVKVVGVRNTADDFLEFLNELGIHLGTQIKVKRKFEFDHSLEIKLDSGKEWVATKQVTQNLLVKEI